MPTAMQRITIQVPRDMKDKLEFLRSQGHSTSGYIRELLELDLAEREAVGLLIMPSHKKGR